MKSSEIFITAAAAMATLALSATVGHAFIYAWREMQAGRDCTGALVMAFFGLAMLLAVIGCAYKIREENRR